MLQKSFSKSPLTQRRFPSVWSELDYICKKVSYWLYTRKQKSGADRYLKRLEKILPCVEESEDAILRQEALALLSELKGHLDGALAHRAREIELMERLLQESRQEKYSASTRAYMLQGRDAGELKKRRVLLASLEAAKNQHPFNVNGKAAKH